MFMSRTSLLCFSFGLLALVSACDVKRAPTFGRGAPESLLDVSSEVVNLGVRNPTEVDELSHWIGRDQPTRAELYCEEGSTLCREARQVLDLYGVPVSAIPSPANTVTLVYERVLARDCNPRFEDDLRDWTNDNHPAFGCAIAANIVQHVSHKQQFVSPNLTDYRDAESAVTNYQNYQRPATVQDTRANYNLDNSTLSNARIE
jgi:hypothetical protein